MLNIPNKANSIIEIELTNIGSTKCLDITEEANQKKRVLKLTENLNIINCNKFEKRNNSKTLTMDTNSSGNSTKHSCKKSYENKEQLSNIITYTDEEESKLEISTNGKSDVEFLLNLHSFIDFISTNLYEIIMFHQNNVEKYNFNNLFYHKYFELFSTNYISIDQNIEIINEDHYKQVIINNISKFLYYIIKKLESEISTIIITMIYLRRIITKHNLFLSINTVLYVFFMLLILAHKYNEDNIYTSKLMSKMINVEMSSFHKMEVLLCHMIDHKFYVNKEEYKFNYDFIINKLMRK